ncbi:MAG: vitamin K epoxide reductase family protein [Deltaproteobacteria bacterium]|nr:vitamin K epoxide reductase family protein [Deltaproteobacteria bacterium]
MRHKTLWFLLIVSLLGVAASYLATQQYFRILTTGFETESFCNINEFINCDVAYSSRYAKFLGVPVSGLGIVFYLWTGFLSFWLLRKKEDTAGIRSLGWFLSVGTILFSAYKAYLSFAVLHVLCLICLSIYLVNILLFLGWHHSLGIGLTRWGNLQWKVLFQKFGIATGVVMAVGYLVVFNVQDKIAKKSSGSLMEMKPAEILPYYFRQSTYPFTGNPEAPVWGNPQAKVVIVEFSDFQCPFCKEAAFKFKPIIAEFKDQVQFRFYHYPLDKNCNASIDREMHQYACLAARATICAAQKGDFWNFHDDLFRNQKEMGEELISKLVAERNWPEEEFRHCLEDPATDKRVRDDIEAAHKIFINGTPTFLINNRLFRYWRNPDLAREILREEIKRAK